MDGQTDRQPQRIKLPSLSRAAA